MSSEPLIGAGQHADPSTPSVNGMPERAYVAMTTLKLRSTQDAIGRLEDELRSIDVDASVDELQGRLRRMLRERRRLHAEELSSAQEVADERVRAVKNERERSAAATARSVTVLPTVVSPEPADDELPEWWPVPAEADEPDDSTADQVWQIHELSGSEPEQLEQDEQTEQQGAGADLLAFPSEFDGDAPTEVHRPDVGVDEPSTDEPGVDEPSTDEPDLDEPALDEPVLVGGSYLLPDDDVLDDGVLDDDLLDDDTPSDDSPSLDVFDEESDDAPVPSPPAPPSASVVAPRRLPLKSGSALPPPAPATAAAALATLPGPRDGVPQPDLHEVAAATEADIWEPTIIPLDHEPITFAALVEEPAPSGWAEPDIASRDDSVSTPAGIDEEMLAAALGRVLAPYLAQQQLPPPGFYRAVQPEKVSFWSTAKHVDVVLIVIGIVIVAAILAAWML